MAPIFKYLNITLLEIVKKLLKIRNPNLLLVKVNFVGIKFNNNSNLKKEYYIPTYFSRSFRRSSRHMLREEACGSFKYYKFNKRFSHINN